MEKFNEVKELLIDKNLLERLINNSNFNGNLEIKEINGVKYIYIRRRINNKNESKYIDLYSASSYEACVSECINIRKCRNRLTKIKNQLKKYGYKEESIITERVNLNILFAKANIKSLIYDQAVLEGVATTFPETEEIIDNGIISGISITDVNKIINLKRAWEFLLDKDIIKVETDYYLLSYIAKIINTNFYDNGGNIRIVPVKIGGCKYIPNIPDIDDVKLNINNIIKKDISVDSAILLALYIMRTQVFIDGNKRAAMIFANHYMIKNGLGILIVPNELVSKYKKLLVEYYESGNIDKISKFMKEYCWMKF